MLNRNSCSDFRSEIGAVLPAPILLSRTTDSRCQKQGKRSKSTLKIEDVPMSVKIAETPENEEFLRVVSGLDQKSGGSLRKLSIAS